MTNRARNLILPGTGNTVGTLDATDDEVTLAAGGTYWFSASQWFYVEMQDTTGFTMGANPVCLPPDTVFEIETSNAAKYLRIKRYDTDGFYTINKVGV